MNTPNGRHEIEQMFGNPANENGSLNHAWEDANIRKVPPPNGWRLFYQGDNGLVAISGIRIHRLLRDSFTAVMDDVWDFAKNEAGTAATDDDVRKWLHDHHLDITGGGYNFRPITGGHALSLHAYGIAIDWDPAHNPRKNPLTRTLPDWWYVIWKSHGWSDGRHFQTPDPMHVQFATGA
jgi:hypothetical protein